MWAFFAIQEYINKGEEYVHKKLLKVHTLNNIEKI